MSQRTTFMAPDTGGRLADAGAWFVMGVYRPKGTALVVVFQVVALRQEEQQEQGGQDKDAGDPEDDEDRAQGGVRGGRFGDLQRGRQQVGELGDEPAPD